MSLWKEGSLRNTPADIAIDSALSVAIISARLPQLLKLQSGTNGISPYYVLFNTLFSSAHLSQTLFLSAYGYPSDHLPVLEAIGKGELRGAAALGGVYGLVQEFLQWSMSVATIIAFSRSSGRHWKNISIAAFSHVAVVLIPAAMIALPKPSRREMGTGILMGFILISNTVVGFSFAILQFYAQFRECLKQEGRSGAFSLSSLAFQIPIAALLAGRWYMRLGKHSWGDLPGYLPASPWTWYSWGFYWMNHVVDAAGSAFLLASYIFKAGSWMRGDVFERQPLL